MRITGRLACAAVLVARMANSAPAQSGDAVVSGTVTLPSPAGQSVLIPGVTLTLTCEGAQLRNDVSDEQGHFRFDHVSAGSCAIVAGLQGFKSAQKAVLLG